MASLSSSTLHSSMIGGNNNLSAGTTPTFTALPWKHSLRDEIEPVQDSSSSTEWLDTVAANVGDLSDEDDGG